MGSVEIAYGSGDRLRVRIVPGGLTPKQTEVLQAVVEHCTVHNSLRQPPEVRIVVGETDVRKLQPAVATAGAA
jgi:hypothetical protein